MKLWEKIRANFGGWGIGLAAAAVGLVLYGEQTTAAAKQAVELCCNLLIPSLFPYFVVSSLTLKLGIGQKPGRLTEWLMRHLFGVGGQCASALLLGLVGGYPVGARTAVELYRKGACSRTEAERLLTFCNNSGPAFVLGAVGVGMLGSRNAGIWLYSVHILSGLLVGIAFRFWHRQTESRPITRKAVPEKQEKQSFPAAFIDAVLSGGAGVLRISAFVVTFAVLTELLFATGTLGKLAELLGKYGAVYGIGKAQAEALLKGMLEVTSGLWSLSVVSARLTGKLALSACLLGWSGLCVHCQVLSFLQGSGLAVKPYLIGKCAQGLLSAGLTAAFMRLFPEALETTAILTSTLTAQAYTSGLTGWLSACTGALFVLWVLVIDRRQP